MLTFLTSASFTFFPLESVNFRNHGQQQNPICNKIAYHKLVLMTQQFFKMRKEGLLIVNVINKSITEGITVPGTIVYFYTNVVLHTLNTNHQDGNIVIFLTIILYAFVAVA